MNKKLGLIIVISSLIAIICFTISISLNIIDNEYNIIYEAMMILVNIYFIKYGLNVLFEEEEWE